MEVCCRNKSLNIEDRPDSQPTTVKCGPSSTVAKTVPKTTSPYKYSRVTYHIHLLVNIIPMAPHFSKSTLCTGVKVIYHFDNSENRFYT